MSNSIKIDNLSKAVKNYLTNFVEDIEDGVKETTEKISKEAVKELKKNRLEEKILEKIHIGRVGLKRRRQKTKEGILIKFIIKLIHL